MTKNHDLDEAVYHQAAGALTVREGISVDEAYDYLNALAKAEGIDVLTIAGSIVASCQRDDTAD